ncbi:BclA C-terminal domain-containing protein [Bacillus marasmi]|uniref:BclA C-terminal domain-containing protein n=1 Tax=Bacillus marasmi TaxID=1926279 RepID=UPI0011C92CEE|nr:hypothetical protein [Bacillus marasmi]
MSLEYMKAVDATEDSMYASNTTGSVISVVLGGTNVPLPNNQNLSSFSVNGANDTFTIPMNGLYFISYQVNITAALAVNSRLILNGSTPLPGSIIDPVLNASSFQNSMIATLNQGDTITLELFGLLGLATLLGGGATGAALNIIRLA